MGKIRRLNRELVLASAAELANEAGDISQITLTQLARKLNVRLPSLYNHVDGVEGLQRELTRWGLQKELTAIRQAISGKVGRAALLATAQAYRQFAHTHPGIYHLTLKAPDPSDSELTALSDELVSLLQLILASYGLQGEVALHAIRAYRSVLHGFVSLETAGGFGLPLAEEESFLFLLNLYLDGLEQLR